MGKIMEPNESEATASMPMLPKLRHPGGLTLVVDHFISEMTDCTQRQKTAPCPPSFQPPPPRFAFSSRALIKIDCREVIEYLDTKAARHYNTAYIREKDCDGDSKCFLKSKASRGWWKTGESRGR